MSVRLSRLAAALATVAVGVTGCGGSAGGTTSGPAGAAPGQRVFADGGCGSCHTLAAAHATGTVGKRLDHARLDVATVERWVRAGGGGMPAFQDQLSASEIQQVAQFVSQASR